MKYLLLTLLLLPIIVVGECNDVNQLSLLQKNNLHKAYMYGEPEGYGYTLAAIAWKESSAGKFRLNVRSNDLGLFQINAKTAEDTLGVTNYYRQVELHQELIYNDSLGAVIAIDVLEHFRQNRILTNAVYKEMIMSYNRGYRWKNNRKDYDSALSYYKDVAHKVTVLKNCKGEWE